jgi:hypothetical protein
MKGKEPEKSAIDLAEEAVYLLRRAPASFWLAYYCGTMPFMLGFLYFIADMSRGAYADDRAPASALAVALLFFWMKIWQYISFNKLRGFLSGGAERPANISMLALSQISLQPWGLFVLPIALLLTIPFAWVYGYYQNLTVAGTFDPRKIAEAHSLAWKQASRWPKQNHTLLLLLSGISLFLFVNVIFVMMGIPVVLTRFLGMKGVFQPTWWILLNTTFLAVASGITHLLLDPFIKACYFLRTFYGESRLSGEDLRLELQRARALRTQAAALLLMGFLFWPGAGSSAHAAQTREAASAAADASPVIAPQVIDKKIEDVLKQSEYTWRLPRDKSKAADRKNWISAFFQSIGEMIQSTLKTLFRWLEDFLRWIFSKFSFNPKAPPKPGDMSFWFALPEILTWLLIAIIVLATLFLLWKYRHYFKKTRITTAQKVSIIPDLMDENLVADQLPEDEWLKLARELIDSGNLRLAIRALFLGGLAALAQKEWITLARFKSNRDYERELRRRAASLPKLHSAFSASVSIYDQVWYGLYDPTPELFKDFQTRLEEIRTC